MSVKGVRGTCIVPGHWVLSRAVTYHHHKAACALLTSGRNLTPE